MYSRGKPTPLELLPAVDAPRLTAPPLATTAAAQVLKAFGAFKLPRNITRSHVVIAKGGELIDIRNAISPGDSFEEALLTVQAAAAKK